jgi:hypothetical protein
MNGCQQRNCTIRFPTTRTRRKEREIRFVGNVALQIRSQSLTVGQMEIRSLERLNPSQEGVMADFERNWESLILKTHKD